MAATVCSDTQLTLEATFPSETLPAPITCSAFTGRGQTCEGTCAAALSLAFRLAYTAWCLLEARSCRRGWRGTRRTHSASHPPGTAQPR
eukprot:764385-Hanusia_phi.AAC.3